MTAICMIADILCAFDMRHIYLFIRILFLIGCDVLDMEYIPTEQDIINYHSSFLVNTNSIRGIYGNYDVDPILFRYVSQSDDPLKHILIQLHAEGWNIIAIIWGQVTKKLGGKKLAIIGMCGISFSIILYGLFFYFGFVQKGGVYDDLRNQLSKSTIT